MRKLLVVLMVLALAAPAAMADDMLDIEGSMRVRAWDKTNHDFDPDTDDDQYYWDQRFRLQGTVTPSDGVQAVFRMNMAENVWGADNMDDLSSNSDEGGVDVDRAYMSVTKGPVTVLAGLMHLDLGNSVAYDANLTALAFAIQTPVVITLGWAKVDEDQYTDTTVLAATYPPASTNPEDTTDEENYEDLDHYFINLGYSNEAMSINAFYAFQTDGAPAAAENPGVSVANPIVEANCIGVQGKFALGPVNINAELDIFGGEIDDGTTTTDLVGTQLFADINMAMSDALTLGAHLVYSIGTDDDNEIKITYLTDDASTVFADYGAMNTLGISPLGADDIFDADTNGDGLADGTGTVGGTVYVQFQVIPDLTLYGQVGYLTAETELDNVAGELDSLTLVNVSAKYMLVSNTQLCLHYGYFDATLADDVDTDNASSLAALIQVDF